MHEMLFATLQALILLAITGLGTWIGRKVRELVQLQRQVVAVLPVIPQLAAKVDRQEVAIQTLLRGDPREVDRLKDVWFAPPARAV